MENKQEFIQIIKANEGLIQKITKVYTYYKQDAEDLHQEIIYQLWKSFPSFRHASKVSTWMYRVALNTSISYLNKEKNNRNQDSLNESHFNRPEITDTSSEDRFKTLYEQIRSLNTIDKGIILLYLEGNSYEDIAIITGFTESNVGTRLGRIKQKLITQINH